MKLANPKKYRHFLRPLYDYLFQSTGIEHHDEWRGEVEWVRKEIDPKDWKRFDIDVKNMEQIGVEVYRMWEKFNIEEKKYRRVLDAIYDAMWEETKVKKKAK